MVCFQTKNPNLGKLLEGLRNKNVLYSLLSFGIFSYFGMFGPKKSGNPDEEANGIAMKLFTIRC
jgi:hypothetical protein